MLIKYIKSKRWGNQNSKFNLFGNWLRWKPYTELLFIKMVHFIKKSERRKLEDGNSYLWIELFQIIYLKIQFHAFVEATFQANEICCYEVNMKFYPIMDFFYTIFIENMFTVWLIFCHLSSVWIPQVIIFSTTQNCSSSFCIFSVVGFVFIMTLYISIRCTGCMMDIVGESETVEFKLWVWLFNSHSWVIADIRLLDTPPAYGLKNRLT